MWSASQWREWPVRGTQTPLSRKGLEAVHCELVVSLGKHKSILYITINTMCQIDIFTLNLFPSFKSPWFRAFSGGFRMISESKELKALLRYTERCVCQSASVVQTLARSFPAPYGLLMEK